MDNKDITLSDLAQQISNSFGELERSINGRFDNNDQQHQEIFARFDDNDRQHQEIFARFDDNDRQHRDIFARFDDNDRQHQEIFARFDDNDRQHRDMFARHDSHDKQLDQINDNQEELIAEVRLIREALDKAITRHQFEEVEKRVTRVEERLGLK